MKDRRVVVTGLGILSPVGNNIKEAWTTILDGKSGVSDISYFDTSSYATHFAASLSNFDVNNFLDKKEIRRTDPFIQYGLISSQECILDSGIDFNHINPERAGIFAGNFQFVAKLRNFLRTFSICEKYLAPL